MLPTGRHLWFREVKCQSPRSLIAAPASRNFALPPSARRTHDLRPPPSEPFTTTASLSNALPFSGETATLAVR